MTNDDPEKSAEGQESVTEVSEEPVEDVPVRAPRVIHPIPDSFNRILDPIGSVAAFIVPFLLYIFTIAPNVMPGDAAELITAMNRFSLPHPPGYPLYILLLKIWTALPINIGPDPVAVRANLFSAVIMSFACYFFFKTARLITGSSAASLAATLAVAVSRTVWKFGVVAEVYALNLLLIVLVLYGIALAREKKNPIGLVIAAFAFGLGLAHHHTVLFLIPLMIVLWPKGKSLEKVPVAGIIAGILLPLVFYAFLPVFAKNTPELKEKGFTAGDFVDYVTRAEYRHRADFQDPNVTDLIKPGDILHRATKYLLKQFGWIALILSVVGLFFAPPGRRIWSLMFALTAVIWIFSVAFLSRGSPLGMPMNYLRSVDEFLLPVNIFLGFGLAWLLAPLAEKLLSQKDVLETEGQNFISAKYIPVIIVALFCVIPFFVWMMNNRYSNMTHHTFFQDQSRNILEQVPEGGILMVMGDEIYIYEYLQQVRGIRTDIKLVEYPFVIEKEGQTLPAAPSLAWYIQNELGDRPIVFTFNQAADAIGYLRGKALRLDGVALTLVDSDDPEASFFVGDPNETWTKYQLRNVDKATFFRMPDDIFEYKDAYLYLVPDDFEYEVFDRYVNGLRASVAWLDNSGYGIDYSRAWADNYADMLEKVRDAADFSNQREEPR